MTRLSRPRFEFVCVAVALSLLASTANAQRIVLLRPRTVDKALLQAFGRLKGELTTYDFDVIVLDAGEVDPSPRQLAMAAERAGAVASVSLVRSEGLATADVWISDRVTGKTTMRTIATSEDNEASSLLAVRAVDLLRASLREFPPGERPPPDVVGASPERAPTHVREWAAPRPARQPWSVDAGIVFQSASSFGIVLGPAISLGYAPSDHIGVALTFQGPLSGAHSSNAGESLSLRNEQAFAEFRYRRALSALFSAEGTASTGVHRLEVEGTARPPYVGRSDSAWTALAAAGAGIEVRLARGVAVATFGRAVLLAPRPVARIAGVEFAYGRPSVQSGVNLRVDF